MRIHYDLHIHTALSPCGDIDMTPNNIVNMAALKGLSVIAVTDHNSVGNARAVMNAAKKSHPGIVVLPGMELTTSEDIHVLCLFPSMEDAEGFAGYVSANRRKIRSNPDAFGNQTYIDEFDHPVGEEEYLLISAADIGIYHISSIISKYNGICMPAHVDKESNGIYAILGAIDADMGFSCVEVSGSPQRILEKYPELNHYNILCNSDAHYLWDISECTENNFLDVENLTPKDILQAVIGGKNG